MNVSGGCRKNGVIGNPHAAKLLDFAVHGVLPHDGVVLFEFDTARCVFAIFLRHIAGGTGQTTGFVFGALEDHLQSVPLAFLCHR